MSDEAKEEMIGGTPHGGRMAPGSERGFSYKQRRPEIDEQLKGELKKLLDQAVQVADYMGHDVILWRVEAGTNSGQVKCQKCDKLAGFALFPMAKKDKINGPAVESRCEKV